MTKLNLAWRPATRLAAHMACVALWASVSLSQGQEPDRRRLREPVFRTAEAPSGRQTQRPPSRQTALQQAALQQAASQPVAAELTLPQHPLIPVLKMAYTGLNQMDRHVTDYTATLVKRERIEGKLSDYEYMYCKVRHKPFSVYMYFLGPKEIKGREVLYVEGLNQDVKGISKIKAHEGSGIKRLVTVNLLPTSGLAMRGQRYPITEIGIRTLTQRLIEVGEQDKQFGECEVKYFRQAKVQDRVCTCVQVVHPVRRKNFRFHVARVYIDDELQIPIRYESYDWPKQQGGRPVLLEEYTYMKLKLNPGLTKADFDPNNPNYKF